MIYYFLPGEGLFGGVKVACQFTELLVAHGMPAVIVTPGGRAPTWFPHRAPVVSEAEAFARLTPSDVKLITWPPDYHRLRERPGRLVCHCQGTDQAMDPIFADPSVPILSCWQQARDHAAGFGRETIAVGIAISDAFFASGGRKDDRLVAYMPRRGFAIARAAMAACPDLRFVAIDGQNEAGVAARLDRAGVFLATSVGEQFGLPALEAMAAGCVVVSVPVKGGMEYLRPDRHACVARPGDLPAVLREVTRAGAAPRRLALRAAGRAAAAGYRLSHQARRLADVVRSAAWQEVFG